MNKNQHASVKYEDRQKSWSLCSYHKLTYDIVIKHGLFDIDNNTLARSYDLQRRALVFLDKKIAELYGDIINGYFDAHNIRAHIATLRVTESKKNLATFQTVIEIINKFSPLRYSEPPVFIGGGVLTDIGGFAAATFRRGMPYLRIPTTLIGMIDAAVGVKNAVNFGEHKNRVGSYYASHQTFIDPQFIKTLPAEHVCNGFAEILKMALIVDKELFEWLENSALDLINNKFGYEKAGIKKLQHIGDKMITRSVDLMLRELAPNLHERVLKRKVDFGHTWSPFIELNQSPPLLHGYAVNIDMALSCTIAKKRGYLDKLKYDQILSLMKKIGVPIFYQGIESDQLWTALLHTIKNRNGKQNIPLPKGIGDCVFINDLSKDELSSVWQELKCEV